MRPILLSICAAHLLCASVSSAGVMSAPPTTTPPLSELPPEPNLPPAGTPPVDLLFQVPAGPPLMAPPLDLEAPPFSEFPPGFETPLIGPPLEVPPGMGLRPEFTPPVGAPGLSIFATTVPEPTTGLLLGAGLLVVGWRKSR